MPVYRLLTIAVFFALGSTVLPAQQESRLQSIGVPACAAQQILHPVWRRIADALGHLPAVLALAAAQQTFQIGQTASPHFGSRKQIPSPLMRAHQLVLPTSDRLLHRLYGEPA